MNATTVLIIGDAGVGSIVAAAKELAAATGKSVAHCEQVLEEFVIKNHRPELPPIEDLLVEIREIPPVNFTNSKNYPIFVLDKRNYYDNTRGKRGYKQPRRDYFRRRR